MSFLAGAAVPCAGIVLFFRVELLGEVQDQGDEAFHVRFVSHSWCRGEAATVVGGAGVGHGGEVRISCPGGQLCPSWSEGAEVRSRVGWAAALFDGYVRTRGVELFTEGL